MSNKLMAVKTSGKQERELKVLLGLVDYFIRSGKPVGSNTLKEAGFDNLSSATIRNYFANLEETGYLKQLHTSGGRVPTEKAYRLFAKEHLDQQTLEEKIAERLNQIKSYENKEIAAYLNTAVELLSQLTQTAVFISAPRFDQDFIIDIKLIGIDATRTACILVTNFGAIHTEILYTEKKLSNFAIKRIENYFHWRLSGLDRPENLEDDEEAVAQKFYNEVMVRYIVGYSHYYEEEIYRTGFSRLLHYPDFETPTALANSLGLFENIPGMRLLLKETERHGHIRYWVGEDLLPYSASSPNCAVVAIPYCINQKVVGALGLLGPMRVPYRELFGTIDYFSHCVSEALTKSLYRFKITFRQPQEKDQAEQPILAHTSSILLEDKTRKGAKAQ